MFDAVGKKYDITNTVLSFGQDARWRRLTRERLNLKPGEKVLDLAAGTAVSTVELAKSGAWCVACDFSRGMLAAVLPELSMLLERLVDSFMRVPPASLAAEVCALSAR